MKKFRFLLSLAALLNVAVIYGQSSDSHESVDLGLSVKWATCNIGAASATASGDHFAWGETETKHSYDWSSYKFGSDAASLSKYAEGNAVLAAEDDAAHVLWGGDWRMPTKEEWAELRNNCTCTWTDNYKGSGVAGRIMKSRINGNSIFLPAAGCYYGSALGSAKSYGGYWSSSLSGAKATNAVEFGLNSDYVGTYNYHRCFGLCIRPVCK